MTIKQLISKYEDLAKELVRCGGCSNILLHCGEKYTIVKIGDNEEGVLCETCQQNNRNIEIVTRIIEDHVLQIPKSQLKNIEDKNNNKKSKKNNDDEEEEGGVKETIGIKNWWELWYGQSREL